MLSKLISKEQHLKQMCILAGVPYKTPFQRFKTKINTFLYEIWFAITHFIIAYLLWGIMLIVPRKYKQYWFNSFEAWCFCHNRKTK
jgi:hypothetical protein